jgi:uncharacterized protein
MGAITMSQTWKTVRSAGMVLAGLYLALCASAYFGQRYLIFAPKAAIQLRPSDPDFRMPYDEVAIPVGERGERLVGWWIPAAAATERSSQSLGRGQLPRDAVPRLSSPKVMLYFCGIGGNKSYYNYLARIHAFHQMGFSTLIVDYRGYGQSRGEFPSEAQVYQDSAAAWAYLRQTRQIPAEQIVLYGESFGGAIALQLASQQPVGGVIVQSSFTSMADMARHRGWSRLLPVDWLLTQRFDSLRAVRQMRSPLLLIHGTADPVVPFTMSQQLYAVASQPKRLVLVPGANHYNLYRPGPESYLHAIGQLAQQSP